MSIFALVIAATAAASAPQERTFWKLEEVPRPQPVQSRVVAELIREGTYLLVYRERGYRFSTLGEADESAQIAVATEAFDSVIFPRLVERYGPCPDVDGNGKVVLLLGRSTRDEIAFNPLDLQPDARAVAFGMHSNEAEVLFLSFSRQGNRAAGNLAALAAAFHRLLHASHDDQEVAWAELLGNHAAVLCDLAGRRSLWGDGGPLALSPSPSDPWSAGGWPLLLLEYLRGRLGDGVLRDLVRSPGPGLAGLDAALAARRPGAGFDGLAADFAMACWLDDAAVADGRFAFPDLAPPRPPLLARAAASRPTSSQLSCGAGGIAHLLIEGDGEQPLPMALRGDPRTRWLGRAVHLRQRGPDEELPLSFDDDGLARLDLPLLPSGDGVVIAVMPRPAAGPDFDRRRFALLWGLGWVPRAWGGPEPDPAAAVVASSSSPAVAESVARTRRTLDRLGGLAAPAAGGAPLTSRYAWSPEAGAVVWALEQEAVARGLATRRHVFLRSAPPDLRQDWTSLLAELPGSDERRWPIVVAAHWDAVRGSLLESYRRALGLDENASGVAAVLEAARAAESSPRRSPVVVALLAGGCHGAVGAAALLEQLQGRVSAWIELDGVGRPARPPRSLEVRVEGGCERDPLVAALATALRHTGLAPVTARESASRSASAARSEALVSRVVVPMVSSSSEMALLIFSAAG